MNEPNGWTTITLKSDVVEDFKRANEIWAKAGVIFIIKEIIKPLFRFFNIITKFRIGVNIH